VLKSDVEGLIQLKCNLSGMPQCEFGLNDKLLIDNEKAAGKQVKTASISLEDLTFHQCVRLNRFDTERVVNFVPPDGTFILMKYRTSDRIIVPFRIVSHAKQAAETRVTYEVTVIAEFDAKLYATKVTVRIPTPENVALAKISTKGQGKAKYVAEQKAIVWRIRKFTGQMELTLRANVDLMAQGTSKPWDRPPISMDFSVPMFAASGMKIRYVRVNEKSGYEPMKWVRYATTAGSYLRRI